MPRHEFLGPLVVLIAGLALVVVMLAQTEPAASVTRAQAYPEQNATAAYLAALIGTPTPTRTTTPTLTVTPTALSPTLTRTATRAPTAVPVRPAQATPTATPTATPSGGISCVPGTTLTIEGNGPARAPLLLFFGTRVVGGGSAGADGTFALPLNIGEERAGEYEVRVRVRGSDTVLRELICNVPLVTPTPLPTPRVQ
jgi:hypothetical protein